MSIGSRRDAGRDDSGIDVYELQPGSRPQRRHSRGVTSIFECVPMRVSRSPTYILHSDTAIRAPCATLVDTMLRASAPSERLQADRNASPTLAGET